jgi:hypothetical protein
MQAVARLLGRLKFETLRKNAPAVARETGKSVPAQIAEIIALRLGVGSLLPHEYYQYRLYDDRLYSWEEKKKFLGSNLENGLIPILREQSWLGLAHDKLTSYAFFRGLGFPIPETYAICHPIRRFGGAPALRTREEIAGFLRNPSLPPLVAKPVLGIWGRDVWAIRRYDPASDQLEMVNGTAMDVESFIGSLDHALAKGVVLQELLRPHPETVALCGERICSVRMVALMGPPGPRLISTLWKIATGPNMADNYWGKGNMVAPIDPQSGRVGRPFSGLGRELRYFDQHPDTGRTLTGTILPDWEGAVRLCTQATASVPGIPMQAWDIALTSRGPVILEVNVNGGMRLPQLTRQAGLYNDEMRNFLASYGFPRKGVLARLRRL